jgi:hypothetical protein
MATAGAGGARDDDDTARAPPVPGHFHIRPAPGHAGLPGGGAAGLFEGPPQRHLYLVGDIVDGWQLRRRWYWPQAHNDVVQKLLRRARKGCRVVYVPGNHDEFARGSSATSLAASRW